MFTFSFLPLAKDYKLVFDMHAYVMYAEQFKCQVIVNFLLEAEDILEIGEYCTGSNENEGWWEFKLPLVF